jgi:hypothetical protein
MVKNSKAKIAANNRYTAKAYDRVQLVIPKGQKATLEAAASKVGESINMYFTKAVLARMGLETWPKIEQAEEE